MSTPCWAKYAVNCKLFQSEGIDTILLNHLNNCSREAVQIRTRPEEILDGSNTWLHMYIWVNRYSIDATTKKFTEVLIFGFLATLSCRSASNTIIILFENNCSTDEGSWWDLIADVKDRQRPPRLLCILASFSPFVFEKKMNLMKRHLSDSLYIEIVGPILCVEFLLVGKNWHSFR